MSYPYPTTKIERHRLGYTIIAPDGARREVGRALRDARDVAARFCGEGETIVECWRGGKTWRKGPRGGLQQVTPALLPTGDQP